MSVPVEATVKPGAARSPLREFVASYARSRIAVAALIVLLLILAVAVGAPLISPQNPYDLKQLDIMDSKLAPGSKSGAGWIYLLGSDDLISLRTRGQSARPFTLVDDIQRDAELPLATVDHEQLRRVGELLRPATGTRLGEISLVSAHASVGALGQGVPVSSHSRMSSRSISFRHLNFLVSWLRNIDASSTMIRLMSGSRRM